jgi:2,4-dienoyl-CoA reductase-like NADH-dependent reductase (Old Yellow Enzyme family)
MTKLWTATTVGRMKLSHRLAMAPMTRSRALSDGTPSEMAAEYYAQRASLGLLISEGTQPSDDGQGYLNTPGIYTNNHITGWGNVADRVHAAGGYLFVQLMHAGRMSHPDNTPHHRQSVAPSAVQANVQMFTLTGMQPAPTPRELSMKDIGGTVADFRKAARAAIKAGADGVEIHGGNGYLIQQFLSENANQRKDEYGKTIEGRTRFALEVATAVVDEIGADRTGFRISPGGTLGDINEGEDGPAVYMNLVSNLAKLNLAYLHVVKRESGKLLQEFRAIWPTALLLNHPGRPREDVAMDIDAGLADIAPIGVWALANPDIVERLKTGAPLNEPDRRTMYGGGSHGYTDYPQLSYNEVK